MARNWKWRNDILFRGNLCCPCCIPSIPLKPKELVAHHLESYKVNPRLRDDVYNGVGLCLFHHEEFHRRYGNSRNTSQQFREFKRECLV